MNKKWLEEKEWKRIQNTLPIVCVDVLVCTTIYNINYFGLIYRDTPHQGKRWCLIGGRVRYKQSLKDAINFQFKSTIGNNISLSSEISIQDNKVFEYFPIKRRGFLYDPRQHSIALTYLAKIKGIPKPEGEAIKFKWFTRDELLKGKVKFGFNHEKVVTQLLKSNN